jgi:hypothetical protein
MVGWIADKSVRTRTDSNSLRIVLYIPDGEFFGVFAFEILEIQFNLSHLLLHIAVGDDGLGTLDMAFLIVNTI